ncbi:MAG: CRISPR-associated helicase/endonuclease Cas3 [Bacteroidetes bacterium RIFOXYA12_FULL_35_11]|nr:MAG: CRISPR-associated helicase/endonuclease Cas3 [Bacteroidetes bacterium GWF2_35_48]OFY76325.1 MAG: CRISPR-associated helicase/endonuclease Cas3 [Bacteroidetes bacterium RIFOXYA12_FULL_35_11]OFY97578.1 MAG: CRISPR-associated helicase/endonuclease Cas3 [Bacteroidetes bacterium RIFOXYB2_FULL_35_7]OFZ04628.1 MAG: CRISPR-associated helicase/endonuclease Cas3 [Bacteroidetes bacterium RIFOXYC12_FULL_35_7]
MVSDINTLLSHPDKLLLTHVQGVRDNTKKLSSSKIAELVALFHDLGKINPNFQSKLDPDKTVNGYANHSYLSAYAFFCTFGCSIQNMEALKQFLDVDNFSQNDLIALTVSIAKHHGNLPDFSPTDHTGTGASILSKDENSALYYFLNQEKNLPVYEFINHFISINDFRQFLTTQNVQRGYSEQLVFKGENNKSALDFFLDNQFAFASVIQADKADAGKIGNIIDDQLETIQTFSKCFNPQLDLYLGKLNQYSELNKLRTTIRNNAVLNIREGLRSDEHVFELTAPTGSGKTLMMLSLASEIIKEKGAKRIIYGLPFLSITEQVEAEVLKIFEGNEEFIQRIDSKSENHRFETIQAELDDSPTEEKILEANILEFQENTFAYPFVITTFVRFFETLLSNRNAELLKLPNFSKCIFLLDEIQALPPRLYGFFVAYIKKFCTKFNSYAIISSATQPNFELPVNNSDAKNFFSDYEKPISLLPLSYFENDLFNRYQIEFEKEPIDIETLKDSVLSENQSVLVILNTIDDTKELFKKLQDKLETDELLLLNTHFTPQHRKLKIYLAKRSLRQDKRIVVVSTQLIEAGVDIDFPVLYRDFGTVASIVQSAGRCNRNGKLNSFGRVKLFKLQNRGKIRSELIYQGKDKEILRFTKESFSEKQYQEKELLAVQKEFFNRIQSELNFARHSQNGIKPDFDFIKDIVECQFDRIGKFQLIDKQLFGEEIQYFVSRKLDDVKFEDLLTMQGELINLIKKNADRNIIRQKKKSIKIQLKKMSSQIVQVRLNRNQIKPLQGSEKNYFGLYKIAPISYSFNQGIDLQGAECLI